MTSTRARLSPGARSARTVRGAPRVPRRAGRHLRWADGAAERLPRSVRTPRLCCCLAVQSCTARFASVIRRAAFSGRPLRSTAILSTRPPLLVRKVVEPRFASGVAAAASAAPAASLVALEPPPRPAPFCGSGSSASRSPANSASRIVPFASGVMKGPMSSGCAAQPFPRLTAGESSPPHAEGNLEPHVRLVSVNAPSRQAGDDAL